MLVSLVGLSKGYTRKGTGRQEIIYPSEALREFYLKFTLSCDFADCCLECVLTGGTGVSKPFQAT